MRCFLALLFPLLLAACAGAGTHGVNSGQPQQPPQEGIVQSVTAIDLPNQGGNAGAMIGGTAGAVAGANTGGGRGSYANAILGGVLGSIAGDAMQNNGTHPGVEIWIKLDSGKNAVVRQPSNPNDEFLVGDRVRLIHDKNGAHAEHFIQR